MKKKVQKKQPNTLPQMRQLVIAGFILLILILSVYIIRRTMELRSYAQNCMTVAQIQSDSRCLYRLSGYVYEIGTRSKPHKGNDCGIDVTTFIPSFHLKDAIRYLDPNLVGAVCSANPTPTTTLPISTPRPTSTPTIRPTNTPTTKPTATSTIRPTNTLAPTGIPTNTPRPTAVAFETPTIVPTSLPTPTTVPYVPPQWPTWWDLIPSGLRGFLEQLYLAIFVFNRKSSYEYLLNGIVPTPTPR